MEYKTISLAGQSGGTWTVTLYADYDSPNTSNRNISVSTYATITSTTSAFNDSKNGPKLDLYINGNIVATNLVQKAGSHGGYNYGTYTTPTSSRTIFYDNEGDASATVTLNVVAGTNMYGPVSGTTSIDLTLPEIGASAIYPTINLTDITLGDYVFEGLAIAGMTSVTATGSYLNVDKITSKYITPSITKSLRTQYTGGNVFFVETGILPPSDTDYYLEIECIASSETGHTETAYLNQTIYGYKKPTYGYNTYTTRCNSEGLADGLGEYGKLHLTWDIVSIGTNTLTSNPVVIMNGTTLEPTSGSIEDGYFEYIFALDTSLTGNLNITLTDKISTNTITSLLVSKANMAISLFDDGTDVGVSFGQMATEKGFNFFTNNGAWPVTIDGLPIGSGSNNGIYVQTTTDIPAGMREGDILIVYEE